MSPGIIRAAARRALLLAALALTLSLASPAARAVEVPPTTTQIYVQTNGPTAPIARGDWYTNTANGAVVGYHYFSFIVPCSWPAAAPIAIDLFSPEMNTNSPLSDEFGVSASQSTTFEVYPRDTPIGPGPNQPGPGGSLFSATYPPSNAPERWERFFTLPAPVACGSYLIRAETSADQQNSWRLRVGLDDDADPTTAPPANTDNPDGLPGTNDELALGVAQTTYQHNVTVAGAGQCITLYEYVGPGQASAAFHNFDMDGNQRITYYAPSDAYDPTGLSGGTAGTLAPDSTWSGGTTTNRGTGDQIANPEPGWWRIVTCADNDNQFLQEGQFGVPSFYSQPPTPAMTLAKSDGVSSTAIGATLSYALAFANTSNTTATPGAATAVVLRDSIPAGTSYQGCAIDAPYSGTCGFAAGVVTFSLAQAVNAGASGAVRVTVQVGPGATSPLVNSATLDYADSYGNSFPRQTATDSDTIPPVDLSIVKDDGGAKPGPGGAIVYNLRYANAGAATATGVGVTETVPAHSAFSAAGSSPGWSCADGAPAGTSCAYALGSVASGVGGSLRFAIRVDSAGLAGASTIANTAQIGDDGTHGPDPTPGDNSSSVSTGLTSTAISLLRLRVGTADGGLLVSWATGAEVGTRGFQILRGASDSPTTARIVSPLIVARGAGGGGAAYAWLERGATPQAGQVYWLREITMDGGAANYGPAAVSPLDGGAATRVYLPIVVR